MRWLRRRARSPCGGAIWLAPIRFIQNLIALATRNALEGWIARGKCFFGVLLIRRGEMADGVTVLQSGIQDLRAGGSTAEYPAFRAVLAHGLALSGRTDEALATSDEAIDRSEAIEELWCAADLLRVKAEIRRLTNIDDATCRKHTSAFPGDRRSAGRVVIRVAHRH